MPKPRHATHQDRDRRRYSSSSGLSSSTNSSLLDISRRSRNRHGLTGVFAALFSSDGERRPRRKRSFRTKKKKRGTLFFSNSSSSSVNSDLAYGDGFVKWPKGSSDRRHSSHSAGKSRRGPAEADDGWRDVPKPKGKTDEEILKPWTPAVRFGQEAERRRPSFFGPLENFAAGVCSSIRQQPQAPKYTR